MQKKYIYFECICIVLFEKSWSYTFELAVCRLIEELIQVICNRPIGGTETLSQSRIYKNRQIRFKISEI